MKPLPEPGSSVELVCVRGGYDSLLSRVPPHGPKVVVRTGLSRDLPVEGELFRVEVAKSWVFGRTAYVSGEITACWLDLERLQLPPLEVFCRDDEAMIEAEWVEDLQPEIAAEILRAGPRPAFEMEQILPEDVVELQWEDDPIVEAAELLRAGAPDEARQLLGQLLAADLRCIDAHVHLGLAEFRSSWPRALARAHRHYAVGVAIGDAALGEGFGGVLSWGWIDNRPYLRCLHGLGLCCWRQGDFVAARKLMKRLLLFNPADNQGIRFLWDDLVAERPWQDSEWGGRPS